MAHCHADMAFLDPPYNVRIGGVVGRGRTKHAEFAMASGEPELGTADFTELRKVLRPFPKDREGEQSLKNRSCPNLVEPPLWQTPPFRISAGLTFSIIIRCSQLSPKS
jgi:hypothetical protein